MGQFKLEDPKLAEVKAILSRLQRMSPDDEPAPMELPMPRKETPRPTVNFASIEIPALSPRPQVRPAPENQPQLQPQPQPETRPRSPEIEERASSLARIGGALTAGCSGAALVLYIARSVWLPAPVARPEVQAKLVAGGPAQTVATPQKPEPFVTVAAAPAAAVAATAPPSVTPPPVPATLPQSSTIAATTPRSEAMSAQQAHTLIQRGEITAGRAALLALSPEKSVEVAWALARSYDPNVVGTIANADARGDVDQAVRWYRQWHGLAVQQGLVADSISVDRIIRSMPR